MRLGLVAVVVGLAVLSGACASGPPPISRTPPSVATAEVGPTPATNVFLPANQDLSNCGPGVERPGCGSAAKGGWRMALVLAALLIGMGLVTWQVARSSRAHARRVVAPNRDWATEGEDPGEPPRPADVASLPDDGT